MKKRLLSAIVSLCLLLTMAPTVAFAADEEKAIITITPADMDQVTEGTTAIAAAIVRMQITHLDTITALQVITEDTAYLSPSDNTYIKENFTALTYLDESQCKCHTRTVKETVLTRGGLDTTAEYEEFGGLSSFSTLETLLIPESAQVINSYEINKTRIQTLTIPDSVLIIESGAFAENRELTGDLVIPDSVRVIGNNAFGAGNTMLNRGTLKLGNALKYIDNNGFKNCIFTGDLIIPDSIEYIGNWVFTPGAFENGTWTLGKNLKHVGDAAMSNICSGNTGTFIIPAGLEMTDTSFGYNTFDKIIFANGVIKIGTRVARDSTKLTEVSLPATVSQFGNGAFSGCKALKTVDMAEGIATVGDSTFSGCTGLHRISLPTTVTTIGANAFGNSGLYGILISDKVTSVGSRAFVSLPEGSVIYLQTDALDEEMATSGWNNRYDAQCTALAMTNGGTFASDTTFALGTLSTPAKTGYKFEGWYENADFSGNAVTTPEAGKTYYAKWVDRELSEITVAPKKNAKFTYGSTLESSDFVVTEVYNNGETVTVAPENYKVSPDTALTTVGESTVTVTYLGKTATCKITAAKAPQAAPAAPTPKDRTYTSITLDKIADSENGAKAEYSKDGGKTWQDSPEFTDLTSGTTYTFAARYAETDTYNASEIATADFATLRHSSGGSSSNSTPTNTISASTASNGKVTLDKSTAKKGNTVTVTVTPDAGYQLDKLTVTDAKGKTVDVTDKGNGKFTFTMPDSKVTITPTFSKIEDVKPSKTNFDDVASSAWYADAVQYVTDKALMNGTDDNQFSPNASTTRGMLMTVLARYAGEDTTGGATWYKKGMNWAKANGVSDGTKPNADITREQLVTMLYRYAGSPKANGSLDRFSDAASVSSYAVNAMQWAVANGIITGSNGKLNPQNNATRAEVSAILMRFCEMSK